MCQSGGQRPAKSLLGRDGSCSLEGPHLETRKDLHFVEKSVPTEAEGNDINQANRP